LMQTSLTVNTLYPSTTRSHSLHQHLKFIHILSSMQRHPVVPLGRHLCHVTTFLVHFAYGDLTHSPSRSTIFSISASVPESYPPFIIGTMPTVRSTQVMHMPRHHHSHTHIRVWHSHPWSLAVACRRASQDSQHLFTRFHTCTQLTLTHGFAHVEHGLTFNPTHHTPFHLRPFSLFAHPFWCPRAGSRTSGMGSCSTRHRFSRNISQSHSLFIANITARTMLHVKLYHPFHA
jgi:hypothetical protein